MSAGERPRLQEGLRFNRHESGGSVSWVVKNPASLKYFRFGPVEAWLMQRMDGTRTLEQIAQELREEVGMNATPEALGVLARRLREMGLVQRTLEERSALLVERLRQQRRLRAEDRSTLLRMRFPAADPDPLLERLVDRMPFFWTRGFVAASGAVFLIYLAIVATHWNSFIAGTSVLYSPTQMTLGIFLIFYGSFAVTAVIHEFGHGMTCKRHGGEVHEMGAMLLYFMPAFYCNVSDAWTFEKRAHRLWVTLAGGWIQLWVAALAAVLWVFTEPGTLINRIGLYTAVLSGGFSVLLNYNPLIPLDGYYALVDMLEMPNLRARSFGYLGALLKRHVLRVEADVPAVTARERRIFLIYGVLAVVYSGAILVIFSTVVAKFLAGRLGGWGVAAFLLILLAVTRRLRAGAGRLLRQIAGEKLPRGRRARALAAGAAVAAVLMLLSAVLPWTVQMQATAVIEPQQRAWVRASEEARVAQVLTRDGARVEAGAVIAVLRSPRIDIEHAEVLALVHELETRASTARARVDHADSRAAELDLAAARQRLALLETRRDALVLRAPQAGLLVAPLLEERIGEALTAGDSVAQIWSPEGLRARVHIEQRTTTGLAVGAPLRIRFPGDPGRTWRTTIEKVEPAATAAHVIALAALPTAAASRLRPGMQGRARVSAGRTTIAGAVMRAVRRTVRGDLFL